MTSTIRGVPGGGFSKSSRFSHAHATKTPGPIYKVPSGFAPAQPSDDKLYLDKKPGPVYKKANVRPAPSNVLELNKSMPHPNRDRTGWIIGGVENDINSFSSVAETNGPNKYYPDMGQAKPQNPRTKFGQDRRFKSLTKQYVSKEHNQANLCTGSPGPHLYPENSITELRKNRPPAYSFRSKGDTVSNRSGFMESKIVNGYLYQAKPATNEKLTSVAPNSYPLTDTNVTRDRAPRPKWTKAERFGVAHEKQFISRKHARAKTGLSSPGPNNYNPSNYDMYQKNRRTFVPGKWCP
jgi:hypothetical protein